MDFDGIEKVDFEGLSDEEILQIYNEVIDFGADNDVQTLISANMNDWAYGK